MITRLYKEIKNSREKGVYNKILDFIYKKDCLEKYNNLCLLLRHINSFLHYAFIVFIFYIIFKILMLLQDEINREDKEHLKQLSTKEKIVCFDKRGARYYIYNFKIIKVNNNDYILNKNNNLVFNPKECI